MVIFISKVQKCYYKININTLPENGVGLYPNISQHAGLSAFKEAFDSTSVKHIPAKNLNKIAEFVLKISRSITRSFDKYQEQLKEQSSSPLTEAFRWIQLIRTF